MTKIQRVKEALCRELAAEYGARFLSTEPANGKHVKLHFALRDGTTWFYFTTLSKSDPRADKNMVSDIKKRLRGPTAPRG